MFGWLFGKKERPRPQARELSVPEATMPKPPPTVYLATSNGDLHDIVGALRYQNALARICGGRTDESAEVDVNVVLQLEAGDLCDARAVAVVIEKQKVGHLSRGDAAVMGEFLRLQGASEAHCLGEIIRGWSQQNRDEGFVVKLDMAWPPVRD